MKFVSKDISDDKCGPEIALSGNQIKRMFNEVNLNNSDIFYDLGCGNGKLVRMAVKLKKVRKSHGIEDDYIRFLGAVNDTKLLMKRDELNRIELWRGKFDKINFDDATVVYLGLSEDRKTVSMFNTVFKHKKNIRIIVLDIPFVGYRPIKTNKVDPKNPFVIMQTPLEEYRVDKNQWIKEVLGKKGTMEEVYQYRSKLLDELEPKDKKSFMTDLRDLVKIRF